ncbi:hypothetical protein B1C78_15540 [Thioalkalivibrio denitrificans]|uniref:Uncharacterized protein n=1 Tax=Thioalkalivibrio denitrificans TaxID=108003 RepID=A0A1V3NAN8_9GAMM|nr:hypothetical protein B1C78_15540 [Thioalkalivibrio denitrificans]
MVSQAWDMLRIGQSLARMEHRGIRGVLPVSDLSAYSKSTSTLALPLMGEGIDRGVSWAREVGMFIMGESAT